MEERSTAKKTQQPIEKQCPYCDCHFEVTPRHPKSFQRIHCSRSCAAKSRMESRSGFNPWSQDEIDYLQSLIGRRQESQVVKSWNGIAKKRGWPTRSSTAVQVKFGRLCVSLQQSRVTKNDNWTMYELSRQLDIPNDRVRKWHRRGLKRETLSLHTTAIRKVDLAMFAALRPEEFWGIDVKYLSKVLGDHALAKYIERTVEQPTVGRPITVIRLDTGDIYRSAKSAACALNIGKHVVLSVCKRDTGTRTGIDFAQLDYPVFWVPWSVREEFNLLAGKLLYELYLQLKNLDGYKKTSCVIVAGRMAVQIALLVFRRQHREKLAGIDITAQSELTNYWCQYFLKNINLFLSLDKKKGWKQVMSKIKWVAYGMFRQMLPASSQQQLSLYLEEYGMWYTEKSTQYFMRKSYLPIGYKPSSSLEVADYFGYIYGSIGANVTVGDRVMQLGKLLGIRYIQREIYPYSRTADLSGTDLNDDVPDKNFQLAAAKACTKKSENCDVQNPFDNLLDYITTLPHISKLMCDRYRLYIDLKLEDCSDKEIATVLTIPESDVISMESELREFANELSSTS